MLKDQGITFRLVAREGDDSRLQNIDRPRGLVGPLFIG
jgi:hypothetical protein